MNALAIIPPGLPAWMTMVLDPEMRLRVRAIDHTHSPQLAAQRLAEDCARRGIPMGITLIASMRADPIIIARTLSDALHLGLPRGLARDLSGDELDLWSDPTPPPSNRGCPTSIGDPF
jgi:hypothetical protein